MKIRKLIIVMFLVSALAFSTQSNYKLTKSKSVTKTKAQIDSDMIAIENEIRNSNIKVVETDTKKFFEKSAMVYCIIKRNT